MIFKLYQLTLHKFYFLKYRRRRKCNILVLDTGYIKTDARTVTGINVVIYRSTRQHKKNISSIVQCGKHKGSQIKYSNSVCSKNWTFGMKSSIWLITEFQSRATMNEVKEVEWTTVASIFTLEADECMWENLKVLEILNVISFLQKL